MARLANVVYRSLLIVLPAAVVVYGCGGSSAGNPPEQQSVVAATYQKLSSDVKSAETDYRATMMGASAAACADVEGQYDAQVRPWVERMMHMSTTLDDMVKEYGGGASADYSCVSSSMLDELDYHRSIACSSANLGTIQTEVDRHVNAMLRYASHTWDRCEQVMNAVNGTPTGFGPMMAACGSWDGECTNAMHNTCCATAPNSGVGMGMMDDGCDD